MSSLTRNIWLNPVSQERIRKLFTDLKPVGEFLTDAVDKLKEDESKGWAAAVVAASPWLHDAAEAVAEEIPFIRATLKLFKKWLEVDNPYEIGTIACTLAYQQSVRQAIEAVSVSVISYRQAPKIERSVREGVFKLAPAEGADLRTFSREYVLQHPFVQRADKLLAESLQAGGLAQKEQKAVVHQVHQNFVENLDLLFTNTKTRDRFAPFHDRIKLGTQENRAYAALDIHAEFQREQFNERPLFNIEPFALKDIYIDTECGVCAWEQIKAGLRPFDEASGGRIDLLASVMQRITDEKFEEAIVIQGSAGAGKSSFTLRLAVRLLEEGFIPIRIQLKRLSFRDSLIEAIEKALEFEVDGQQTERSLIPRKGTLLDGRIFDQQYGSAGISRYVLILDGWDELSVGATETLRDKAARVLHDVREEMLRNRAWKVRVVITGRPSADVSEASFRVLLDDSTPIFTMRPLQPEHLRVFVQRLHQATNEPPESEVAETRWRVPPLEQFEPVFNCYEAAFHQTTDALSSQAMEVLGYPQLAYAAIRVMSQMPNEESINEMLSRPSRLYQRLIDLTCDNAAKLNKEKELQEQWRYFGPQLRELLCHTAAAITACGQEQIGMQELEARLITLREHYALQGKLRPGQESSLSKLLVSFYFTGGFTEQGCEFLHHSFCEYLFAEAVVATLKGFGNHPSPSYQTVGRDFDPQVQKHLYDLSRSLINLLAPQWLTQEVAGHLEYLIEWEIERARKGEDRSSSKSAPESINFEQWKNVRDALAILWKWWISEAHIRPQLKQGRNYGKYTTENPYACDVLTEWMLPLPAPPYLKDSFESMSTVDANFGEALFRLCALTHYYVAVADGWTNKRDRGGHDLIVEDLWAGASYPGATQPGYQTKVTQGDKTWILFAPHGGDPKLFQRCIARINSAPGRPQESFPERVCSPGIDLRKAELPRVSFAGAHLDKANLDEAVLIGSNLSQAHLVGARLCKASLDGARLNDAVCDGAVLDEAVLDDANLSSASFIGASLAGAVMSNAKLYRTQLGEAILDGADLSRVRDYGYPEQIKDAFFNEETRVPQEWQALKQIKLGQDLDNEIGDFGGGENDGSHIG